VPELTRAAPLRRVGHKGADLIAPGNTRESFDAALQAGVDMIEFDVLPEDHTHRATTRLLLAHDYEHDLRDAVTLEEGVAHLTSAAFGDVELDVDLKLPGYEERVVKVLQEHGLVERAIVSSQYMRSLVSVRALEPGLRVGWSVPRAKRDLTTSKLWLPLALTVLAVWRRRIPGVAGRHLRERRIDAVMAHWRLVTPQLVRTIHDAGGELYVWTVDDAAKIRQLEAMGVDAVITNDPRLFG
jgi:glycerophosphoryl diester phosphodiesterase